MIPTAASSLEGRAAAMAAAQHGIVTRPQLLAAGLTGQRIERWVARGLLRRMHAGVYLVGPIQLAQTPIMAAVLACPGAVVSHRTAAGLWQLLPALDGDPIHITAAAGQRRRAGICAHRSSLSSEDVVLVEGIPRTRPARTLLDLAGQVSARELEQALAAAERTCGLDRAALLERLRQEPKRRGRRELARLLHPDATCAFTRSVAEENLLVLIRRSGLPEPEWNVRVAGFEVDCYWRRERLVVEVDGYAFHSSAHAFVRDRRRDSALAAAGIRVLRLTWHQLKHEPVRTVAQLAPALARGQ